MLTFRKPEPDTIQEFLDCQAKLEFSYSAVGATGTKPPSGFVVDHTRAELGRGEQVFEKARSALNSWQHLQLGWLNTWPAEASVREGEVIGIVARSLGLWWLNACRIVYVINETSGAKRFGFANGTLPDHAGTGEERFLVEMDDDGTVWYDILAFSRPQHFFARIGYPYVRHVQKRFGKQSASLMKQIINDSFEHKENFPA
jgi:uncharacterized protein (UPF0548 family)